ncbi:hypothetical protein NT6N_13510 [Oceaniferula spumae]|uniref:Uncharacterized protein n=1 Tax=Oceaniferula spumae TaxID=2979115 RepID=A0AAT9FK34_9BACT
MRGRLFLFNPADDPAKLHDLSDSTDTKIVNIKNNQIMSSHTWGKAYNQ